MSLSEQEQRALREIERSLLADDPSFGASVQSESNPNPQGSFSLQGLAIGVVGLVMLVAGVALAQVSLWFIIVGVLGFLVMLGAGVWMLRTPKSSDQSSSSRTAQSGRRNAQSGGNAGGRGSRMEENFRRRFEEGQQ